MKSISLCQLGVLHCNVDNFVVHSSEQAILVHRGQGMDIYWRDTYQCPTEAEYKQMVINSKLLLLFFIFRIVTDIQQIYTYLVGYNSWSFHLSIIAVTYDLNKINKR